MYTYFVFPLLPDNVNTVEISVARNLTKSNWTIAYYIDNFWKIDVFVSLDICTIQWDSRRNEIIRFPCIIVHTNMVRQINWQWRLILILGTTEIRILRCFNGEKKRHWEQKEHKRETVITDYQTKARSNTVLSVQKGFSWRNVIKASAQQKLYIFSNCCHIFFFSNVI